MIIKSVPCFHGNGTGVYVSPGAAISTLAEAIFIIFLENTSFIPDFSFSSPSKSILMLEKIQQCLFG